MEDLLPLLDINEFTTEEFDYPFLPIGKKTNGGNLFDEDDVKKFLEDFDKKKRLLCEEGLLGGFAEEYITDSRFPESHRYEIDLDKITHYITEIRVEESYFIATVKFIDSPVSRHAYQQLMNGHSMLRATMKKDWDHTRGVSKFLNLISIDIVPISPLAGTCGEEMDWSKIK